VSEKIFAEKMAIFELELKQLNSSGVEIYLAAINPEGHKLDPMQMMDESGVI
jgi:hypothetical protein